MSDMTAHEAVERFDQGMKKAASRARELAAAQKNRHWNKLAFQLEKIRDEAMRFYAAKPLTEQEVTRIVERRISEMPTGEVK
jgi:hypothetical protein